MQRKGKEPRVDQLNDGYNEPRGQIEPGLSDLPKGWVWVAFDKLWWDAEYGTSEKCDDKNHGTPILRIPNVSESQIDLSDLKYTAKPLNLDDNDWIAPNDFLIIRTNGSKNLIGRGARAREEIVPHHYFASYLIRFRLINIAYIGEWVSLIWNSPALREEIEKRAATTAGQYNVSLTRMAGLTIPLPPENEIKRIISEVDLRFSILDSLGIHIQDTIKQASYLKQSILKSAFSGKLVAQDSSDEPASVLLERIRNERANLQAKLKPSKVSQLREPRRKYLKRRVKN